jgi:YggT family protein
MFVLGNFVQALAQVLSFVIDVLWWLIVIRALLSWVSPDPYNPIVQFIEKTTEPILFPLRQLIPVYKIGIDISPILAILILYFLKSFAVQTLIGIGLRLK